MLGDESVWTSGTSGAEPQSLLLHTIGECILIADDDMICHVAASPGFKRRAGFKFWRKWPQRKFGFIPEQGECFGVCPIR